jgi:hypothetical protein
MVGGCLKIKISGTPTKADLQTYHNLAESMCVSKLRSKISPKSCVNYTDS